MQVRHEILFSGLGDYIQGKLVKFFYDFKYKTKMITIENKIEYNSKGGSLMKVLLLNNGNILCAGNSYFIMNTQNFEIIKENSIEKNLKSFLHMIEINSFDNKTGILFYDNNLNFGFTFLDDNYNFSNAIITNLKGTKINSFDTDLKLLSNKKIAYIPKYWNYDNGCHIYILSINKITYHLQIETVISTSYKNIFFELKNKKLYLLNFDNYISLLNNKNYKCKQNAEFSVENNMKILCKEQFLVQGEKNGEIKIYNINNFSLLKSYVSNKINKIYDIFIVDKKIFFTLEYPTVDERYEATIKKWEYDEEKNEIICYGYFNTRWPMNQILKIKNESDLYLFVYKGSFEIIKIND